MLKARRTQMLLGVCAECVWVGVWGERKDTKLTHANAHLVPTCAPANKTWAHPVLYLHVSFLNKGEKMLTCHLNVSGT